MSIRNYPNTLPINVKAQLDVLTGLLEKHSADTMGYALPCIDIMLEYILRQEYAAEQSPEDKTYYQETITALRLQKRDIVKQCVASNTTPKTRAAFMEATQADIKWSDYGFETNPITQDLYDFQQTLLFAEPKMFHYLTDLLDIEHQVMQYRIALNNDIRAHGDLSEADSIYIKELMESVKSSIQTSSYTIPMSKADGFSASPKTNALSPDPGKIFDLKKKQTEFRGLPLHASRKKNLSFKRLDMSPNGPHSLNYLWAESESPGELEYKDSQGVVRMKLTPEGKRPFEHRKDLLKAYADRIDELAAGALAHDLATNFQRNGHFNSGLRGGIDDSTYSVLQNTCLLTLIQVHMMGLYLVDSQDILDEEKYKALQNQLWELSYLLENVESGPVNGFENLSFHCIDRYQIGNTDERKEKFKNAYIATESLGEIQEILLKKMAALRDAGTQEVIAGKQIEFDGLFDLARKIMQLRCSLVQDVWNNLSLSLDAVKVCADTQARQLLMLLPSLCEGSEKIQQAPAITQDVGISAKSKLNAVEVLCSAMAIGMVIGVFAGVAFIGLSHIPALAPFTDAIVKRVTHIAAAFVLTVAAGVTVGAASGGVYYAYHRPKNAINHEAPCDAIKNAAISVQALQAC